jgi:hypothetical protein
VQIVRKVSNMMIVSLLNENNMHKNPCSYKKYRFAQIRTKKGGREAAKIGSYGGKVYLCARMNEKKHLLVSVYKVQVL